MSVSYGVPIFALLLVVMVIVIVVICVAVSSSRRRKSIYSPVITANAVAVSKRSDISQANAEYYITFEFENGQRRELTVSESVYGRVSENENGRLTYQGIRFLEFERF